MRTVTQGDVAAAARALLACPEDARAALLVRLLADAHAADRYRRVFGRVHPRLGNGTLMATALARTTVPEPVVGDMAYLRALAQVIEGVLDWHASRRR